MLHFKQATSHKPQATSHKPQATSHKPFKLGFTLSELLVSLAVLGLIAGLTVPSIVTSVQISQERNAAKEAYSALSAAIQQAYMEGTLASMSPAERSLTDPNSAYVKWFRSTFSGSYCENGDVAGKCSRIGWHGHYSNNAARVILSTGAVIASVDDFATWGAGFGTTTQSFMIDGNGGQKGLPDKWEGTVASPPSHFTVTCNLSDTTFSSSIAGNTMSLPIPPGTCKPFHDDHYQAMMAYLGYS